MVLNRNTFDNLPEKEQVHRLHELADAALEKFGFNQYRLTFLQHLVNTTFSSGLQSRAIPCTDPQSENTDSGIVRISLA